MTFTVTLSPLTPTGVIGGSQTFTATPAGETPDGTITYVWTVDDIAQESTAATMDYTLASPAGTKKIKVVATNTLSAGDPEIAEASTTITVNKKENNSTVAVTPASPAAVEIGTATTFTANVSNQPSGAAIAYTWKVDGVAVDGQKQSTFEYTPTTEGTKSITCSVTVTATDYVDKTVESSAVSLTVNKKANSSTLKITPESPTTVFGVPITLTANVSGAPSGATTSFQWSMDDSNIPDATSATYKFTPTEVGSKTLKCTVSVSASNYVTKEISAEATVVTNNATFNSATISLSPPSVNTTVGGTATLTASVTGAPGDTNIVYSWKKDNVAESNSTNTYSIDTSSAGTHTIKVEAVLTKDNYTSKTISSTAEVVIAERTPIEPEGELPYVHPLPHRTSAYIWCGWWVMDEIQKMTEEGKDWKIDDPGSKYYLHRYTLQKMMKDYPEVDVQESRNGYIIHKTALETGIIYTYP
ncbi:capsid and scaffold protein [Shigella phage ESh27]|nr:capsid and scaffold protein [Shigella phage ESh27]